MPREFRPIDARRLLGTGPVVILEIGANDGEDTLRFCQAFNHRRTHIYAFECDSRAIAKWKNNVKDIRASLEETALSNVTGTIGFYGSTGCPKGYRGEWDKSGSILPNDRHTEHAPWLGFYEPITVPSVTLDEWASKTLPETIIDFCWVDVQGAEHLVILGGLKTLRRVRYWYCECDPRPNYQGQATLEELKMLLEENGFSFQGEYGSHNFLWKNDQLDAKGDELVNFDISDLRSSPILTGKDACAVNKKVTPNPKPPQPTKPLVPVKKVEMKPKIVKTKFMGQFGNQLFQYVAGKIMAEVTGLAFMPPPCFLTKKGSPVTWTESQLFFMRPTPLSNYDKEGPEMSYTGLQWIDWYEYEKAGAVTLQGYFQRYECLKPWKEQIKNEWLRLEVPFVDKDLDAVHVHCRRTDYIPGVDNPNRPECHGISTTIDEYRECLKEFPEAKRIVVHTDDPNDAWLNEFKKLGLPWTVNQARWDEDFLALASCRWMIMSQSTFSWWAAFLGRAERIACPLTKGTLWHYGKDLYGPPVGKRDYPNLRVDDELDRWAWVEMS